MYLKNNLFEKTVFSFWRKNACNIGLEIIYPASVMAPILRSTFSPEALSKSRSVLLQGLFWVTAKLQPSAWWPLTSNTTQKFKMQLKKGISSGHKGTELISSTFFSWKTFTGPYDGHTAIITAKQLLVFCLDWVFIMWSCFLYKQSTWATTQMFSPSPAL